MPLIRVPKPWENLESQITPETAFLNRRRFMTNLIGAGVTASLLPLTGCQSNASSKTALEQSSTQAYSGLSRNRAFAKVDRAIDPWDSLLPNYAILSLRILSGRSQPSKAMATHCQISAILCSMESISNLKSQISTRLTNRLKLRQLSPN